MTRGRTRVESGVRTNAAHARCNGVHSVPAGGALPPGDGPGQGPSARPRPCALPAPSSASAPVRYDSRVITRLPENSAGRSGMSTSTISTSKRRPTPYSPVCSRTGASRTSARSSTSTAKSACTPSSATSLTPSSASARAGSGGPTSTRRTNDGRRPRPFGTAAPRPGLTERAHRRSVDSYFFSETSNVNLDAVKTAVSGGFDRVEVVAQTATSLHLLCDGLPIHFVRYAYPPLEPTVPAFGVHVAGVRDLARHEARRDFRRRGLRRDFRHFAKRCEPGSRFASAATRIAGGSACARRTSTTCSARGPNFQGTAGTRSGSAAGPRRARWTRSRPSSEGSAEARGCRRRLDWRQLLEVQSDPAPAFRHRAGIGALRQATPCGAAAWRSARAPASAAVGAALARESSRQAWEAHVTPALRRECARARGRIERTFCYPPLIMSRSPASVWQGGRVRDHAALDEADEAFWAAAGPVARFEASLELAFHLWRLRTPMKLPRDLAALLTAFVDGGVRFLVVGGHAVSLHARPRATKDSTCGSTRRLRTSGAPAPRSPSSACRRRSSTTSAMLRPTRSCGWGERRRESISFKGSLESPSARPGGGE